MAVKKIELYGSKILRQPSVPVKKISSKIKGSITDLFDTLSDKNGLGLAASQIGLNYRIFVVDLTQLKKKDKFAAINPVIIKKEEEVESEEGCLSFPEIYIRIPRSKIIELEYTNEKGRKECIRADGILSIVIQHEFDHLNGILMIDRIKDEERKKAVELEFKSKNSIV